MNFFFLKGVSFTYKNLLSHYTYVILKLGVRLGISKPTLKYNMWVLTKEIGQ